VSVAVPQRRHKSLAKTAAPPEKQKTAHRSNNNGNHGIKKTMPDSQRNALINARPKK